MIYQYKKNKKGFTLIEILVSISIIVMIMLATAGIFRSVSSSQKRMAFDSVVLNDVNYFLKLASENIQGAEIGNGSSCGIASNKFFDVQTNFISFIKNGECYYFEAISDGDIKRMVMYTTSKGENYISSKKTNIISLDFEVEDYIEFGQPLVTISIKAAPENELNNYISAQTSVSVNYYE
ncbi:MAG TPA: type II secretion system protein [bacterium]|nr:type II secretion system protein [bacterium]HPV65101.1 type II secretion system protein [bacterium]